MNITAHLLTEVEETRVGSRGRVTGGRAVRTQQVSKQIRSGGLSRGTHSDARTGARPHPKRVKQVAGGCRRRENSASRITVKHLREQCSQLF